MQIKSRTANFQNAKKVNDKRAINGSNWAFNENTFLTAPHRAHRAYQMATNGMGFISRIWRLVEVWLDYDVTSIRLAAQKYRMHSCHRWSVRVPHKIAGMMYSHVESQFSFLFFFFFFLLPFLLFNFNFIISKSRARTRHAFWFLNFRHLCILIGWRRAIGFTQKKKK